MKKNNNNYLYIFSNNKIAKINKSNGEIVWETKLNVAGIKMATVGNLQLDGDYLYFGANGKLICLKENDGSLIWKNDLKGWGYSYVCFANQSQNEALHASNQAAAAVAAS